MDHKEGQVPKNWCFQVVVLEKNLEIPLDCKEIKSVNSKGNQPWIFIGSTVAEAGSPILWPPDVKNWLIGKDPHAGKEEKGIIENEMVGWHYRLDGLEFEQAPGDGDGQGSLVFCSPQVRKESDITEWLNSNNMGTELGCPCTTHSKFNEVQTCLLKLPVCKKCFTWEGQEKDRKVWCAAVHGLQSQTWLSDWPTTTI